MKKIKFFPTLKEYQDYIENVVITSNEFKSIPFYRGLIDFVIDHRSPLFFEQSHDYEYAHFSQYFNFVLMRGGYENSFISDMFFFHDFIHMIFRNPINVRAFSYEYFDQIATINEYVASNDTEIMTYYRLPHMRSQSLPYPILYDLLKDKYPLAPSTDILLNLRKDIILNASDVGLASNPDASRIFKFLRKFKYLNPAWTRLWYDGFPSMPINPTQDLTCLSLLDYQDILNVYQPLSNQNLYERNILRNVRNAEILMGKTNLVNSFYDIPDALKEIEDKVILDKVAQQFNKLYQANRG